MIMYFLLINNIVSFLQVNINGRQEQELLPPTQPFTNAPTSIPVPVAAAPEKIQLDRDNLCKCLDKEKKKHKDKHKIHKNSITADSVSLGLYINI